jgi:hypothetical protein
MTTATAPTTLVGDLILVRLLVPPKTPLSPSKLRADLARFFAHPPAAEEWQRNLSELVEASLLTVKPYRLTEAGRARALEFLGLDTLPPRTDWRAIKNRHLLPRALGISADETSVLERIKKADGLAALLLKARYDLPAGPATTPSKALEALVCKHLGFPGETSIKAVCDIVINRLLGTTERLAWDRLAKQFPARLVGARTAGVDDLRQAILRRWVGQGDPRPLDLAQEIAPMVPEDNGPTAVLTEESVSPAPSTQVTSPAAELDLPEFAATVQAAARHSPTGWFGDNKVFINHVWRQLQNEPGLPSLDLAGFKTCLVEANNAGLLHLSRADLVQAMDPADIQESETSYLNAVFHFILVERAYS